MAAAADAKVGGGVVEQADHSRQCLCGAVSRRTAGLRDIWFCRCAQYRKVIGRYLAARRTKRERIDICGEVSRTRQPGRCACGARPMFRQQPGSPTPSIRAGSIDSSHGIPAVGRAFGGQKGDYCASAAGLSPCTVTSGRGF